MLKPVRTVEIFQTPSSPKTFLAGEVIFEEGQPGDVMYGILTGEVELVINGKVVETIQAGDVFGEGALVQPEHTRASTAIAKTYCQIAFLDQEHFLFAVQQTPMFAIELLRSYSDRLRHLKHRLSQLPSTS